MATKISVLVCVSDVAYRQFHTHLGELNDGVLYGFLRSIVNVEKELRSHHDEELEFKFLFDSRCEFRKQISSEYKAPRALPENRERYADLYRQIGLIRAALDHCCLNHIKVDGVEADDLAAHFITEKTYIVSNDKDMHQLLKGHAFLGEFVIQLKFLQQGLYLYTVNDLLCDFNCTPHEYFLARLLTGDKADNIQGIDGVGIKTAVDYVQRIITRGRKFDKIRAFIDSGVDKVNKRLMKLPSDDARELIDASVLMPYSYSSVLSVPDPLWNEMCLRFSLPSLKRKTVEPKSTSERFDI